MNWKSIAYDWNQVRAFLVTAEEGSFSAAAQSLGITQPTVGRQVSALEHHLGITLFERLGRQLALTEAGLELLEHVRQMGEAAGQVALAASGKSQSIEGQVTITATDGLAVYLLPTAIKKIREVAPRLTIEIVASNQVQDLRRREADIGIRHARPSQPDLIARFIRTVPMRLFVSQDYVERKGAPWEAKDLSEHDFITFDSIEAMPGKFLQLANLFNLPFSEPPLLVMSENASVAAAMVENGLGIGTLAEEVAERSPNLLLAFPDRPAVEIPIWLVTHRELRTSRRIRLVFDILAASLKERYKPPYPLKAT